MTNPFATLAQSHSDVTTFKFNNTPVSIVVNPYVAPARSRLLPDPHQQHSAPDLRVWGASRFDTDVPGRLPAPAPTGSARSSVPVRDDRRIARLKTH